MFFFCKNCILKILESYCVVDYKSIADEDLYYEPIHWRKLNRNTKKCIYLYTFL